MGVQLHRFSKCGIILKGVHVHYLTLCASSLYHALWAACHTYQDHPLVRDGDPANIQRWEAEQDVIFGRDHWSSSTASKIAIGNGSHLPRPCRDSCLVV